MIHSDVRTRELVACVVAVAVQLAEEDGDDEDRAHENECAGKGEQR